jgi:type IV secretory pathway VirB10-like protein
MTVTYHSDLVKLMFPSEFPFNIVLIVETAIIIISYAILIIKLKPSIETEPSINRHLERKKKPPIEPTRLEKPTTPAETKKITNEKPVSPVETQETLEEPTESIQTKAQAETAEIAETREKHEPKKDEEAKKSFLLFGERDFEGCPHKFGYLNSLPKNTPIPDECFGCPQIVECLRNLKPK